MSSQSSEHPDAPEVPTRRNSASNAEKPFEVWKSGTWWNGNPYRFMVGRYKTRGVAEVAMAKFMRDPFQRDTEYEIIERKA